MGIMAPHEGREWKIADYPENIVSAIGVALTTDELTLLEARIDSLPDKYRSALLLHYRDGMTYKAIAEELSLISLASAYGVVRTAVARLRWLYEGKKPRRTTTSRDELSKEQISHEMAVARNDRDVQVGEDGKGWFEGFAAPRASEFFATSVPAGRDGAEVCVDNIDGGRPV